ncbi:MAG: hypothetical protein WBL68_12045 [Nitrososphaeraceae archaeon]
MIEAKPPRPNSYRILEVENQGKENPQALICSHCSGELQPYERYHGAKKRGDLYLCLGAIMA